MDSMCPTCHVEVIPRGTRCPWCDTRLADPPRQIPATDPRIEIPALITSRQITLPKPDAARR